MRPRRRPPTYCPRLGLGLLGLVLLTACGAPAAPTGTGGLQGPPLHEATHTPFPGSAGTLGLRAQSPCVVRFLVDGLGDGTRAYPDRRLAAGEAIRIWWRHEVEPGVAAAELSPPEARAEGRTFRVSPRLEFAIEGEPVLGATPSIFVRSETHRTATWDYAPPVQPEPLLFGSRLEIMTVVVADTDGADPKVRPRTGGNRVRPQPSSVTPPAQARVFRVWLEVEQVR